MDILQLFGIALSGYLIGSLSSARLVKACVAPRADLSSTRLELEGTDKTMDFDFVSATTVGTHLGARWGFVTMLLDLSKIALPTLAARALLDGSPYFLALPAAGLIGHIWPIYHRFQGGRGILAIFAGFLAIDWLGALVTSLFGYLLGVFVIRDVLCAYMIPVLLVIPWLWVRTHNPHYIVYALFVNLVFAIAMIPEIRNWLRLRRDPQWRDPTKVLELSGMGRGILRLARRLGITRSDATGGEPPS